MGTLQERIRALQQDITVAEEIVETAQELHETLVSKQAHILRAQRLIENDEPLDYLSANNARLGIPNDAQNDAYSIISAGEQGTRVGFHDYAGVFAAQGEPVAIAYLQLRETARNLQLREFQANKDIADRIFEELNPLTFGGFFERMTTRTLTKNDYDQATFFMKQTQARLKKEYGIDTSISAQLVKTA